MPPLDVIMVWHAFLLNPKPFTIHLPELILLCLPNIHYRWIESVAVLTILLFEFNVPEIYRQNYSSLLQSFINDPNDLIFDPIDDLLVVRITDKKVKIYCPRCQNH